METKVPYSPKKIIKIGDEEHCVKEWCKIKGISQWTYNQRVNQGMTPQEAFLTPKKSNWKMIEIGGISHCVKDWCKIKGISYQTIRTRVKRGMSYREALLTERQFPWEMNKSRRNEVFTITLTIDEISQISNRRNDNIRKHLKNGWTIKEILFMPRNSKHCLAKNTISNELASLGIVF